MEKLSLDGYLTKQEVQEQLGRHRRTLTEDVRKALVKDDTELLSLLRVHTQDGEIREGSELSIDSLKELTREGLNPTVYLHPDFVEKVLQRRNASSAAKNKSDSASVPSRQKAQQSSIGGASFSKPAHEPSLPDDPEIRSIVLEHLHFNDRKHQEENKALMDRILQVVETNQKLQGQTNELFNQFQNVLKEGGGVCKTISAPEVKESASRIPDRSTSTKSSTPRATVVEVLDSASTVKKTLRKRVSSKKKTSTPKKKGTAKKAVPRKKPSAKKPSFWKRDVRDLLRR